ncbi:hypothetical protein BOX15_Mlig002827g4 [Macrostomum lignano]|uniref:Ion transport domain-containing protein n=1 Tax=Macrostomum lignano TaxID=282301 RepID=A0A267EMW8_9PLAT|nr:hypothetical protein BOX15_Mlig002827g4 [Macrostomum lignano]
MADFDDSSEKPQAQSSRGLSFSGAANLKQSISKWKTVTRERRHVHDIPHKSIQLEDEKACPVSPLLAIDDHNGRTRLFGRDLIDNGVTPDQKALNKRLLVYFVRISTPDSDLHSNELDTDFIMDLIAQGADLNAKDRYGQTVLHEVAANWSPSVMDLMIECGGNPNAADYLGWTPLHVAAASNYPEMCRVLVRRRADKEAKSSNDQTPLFFAAKTDSARSLRALIKLGCKMEVRDKRNRTPLFAASELDRSATSAVLLEHGADAFSQDSSGQIAFVPLLQKMPPLAKAALEQLYETFRIERVQRLDLFRLDPIIIRDSSKGEEPKEGSISPTQLDELPYVSAVKAITRTKNFLAIKSPVVQEFIRFQWINYGRWTALWQVLLQLATIILWTVFAVMKEWTQRYEYQLPEEWYRILILVLAILLTLYNIGDEIHEYLQSKKRHERWKKWRLEQIDEDRKHCHAKHSEELDYWLGERAIVVKSNVSYFSDFWNYLDWMCYLLLVASIVSHFVDVGYPGGEGNLIVARWHVRIMAANIVLLWVRLLKYAKPFEFFGPFIVMLGMIAGDLLKFFLLYLEFLIPFACVFWTILGGENNLKEADVLQSGTLKNYTAHNFTKVTVKNFGKVNELLFSVFRITLVDDYDYAGMILIDQITSQILLGVWFAVSTILFLNLFIAQLSESFKQVYDNAKAAAVMQKAITLNEYYENMLLRNKVKYHQELEKRHPLEKTYDDDVTDVNQTEELQKATLQIRSTVEDIKSKFDHLYEAEIQESDDEELIDGDGEKALELSAETHQKQLSERIGALESTLDKELKSIKSTLRDLAIVVAGGRGSQTGSNRRPQANHGTESNA